MMSPQSSRSQYPLLCCGLLGILFIAGCSESGVPHAEFVITEQTKDLLPKARAEVEKVLKENFGTPHQLVAWEKLPVEFGGSGPTGKVAFNEKVENTDKSFLTSLPGRAESAGFASYLGKTIKFTSGANLDKTGTIKSYNPKTGLLELESGFESIPEENDEFLIEEPGWRLVQGRHLYMKHCLHCHGVSGDGNGPTAKYLNPRPRDYRAGIFKFTSTLAGIKATREDLGNIIREGIPGTSMPSFFVLLKPDEIPIVVEYVRWLAIRGELEKKLSVEFADYKRSEISKRAISEKVSRKELEDTLTGELETFLKEDYPDAMSSALDNLINDWVAAEDPANLVVPKLPRVPSTPESIQRGRALYMSDGAKCFTCHGQGGKGDGVSTTDYWDIPGSSPVVKYEVRGLHDMWGNPQKPRNLTLGIYRGGRRPVDLYRRIYSGIKGTQMAAFGGSTFKTDEEIWDVVNYILAVPHQDQTPSPTQGAGVKQAANEIPR